jgi:hypothetical protein
MTIPLATENMLAE